MSRWAVLAAALALAACGERPPRDLRTGLLAAGALEIVAPEGPLLAAATRLAPALARARGVPVAVLPAGTAGDPSRARVVLGTLACGEALELAALLAIEPLAPGAASFRFAGREYSEPGDLLAATLPDPARPGRPATLFLGADAGGLARHLARLDPGWRPAFRSFRSGEPEREGPLARAAQDSGAGDASLAAGAHAFAPIAAELVLRERRAAERRPRLVEQRVAGFRVLRPPALDLDRVIAYVPAAREARRRAAQALGATEDELREVLLVLYDDAAEMEDVLGALDLSVDNRVEGAAHVLLAPGLQDDRGAAAARLAALSQWGAPAEEALLAGFGAWAAGAWFGVPLASWPAHLARVPGAPAELAPLDHLSIPFFAELIGELLDEGGPARLRAAWDQDLEQLLRAADAPGLERRLAERADAWRSSLEARAPRRAERLARLDLGVGAVWTRGAVGYHRPAAAESLARAAELGLDSVAIPVYAWPANDPPELPDGRALRRPARGIGDVELVVAAARARAAGLSVMLAGHLLTSPSGSWWGERPFATDVLALGEFFDALRWHAAELVLLAELAGAELVALAEALPDASRILIPSEIGARSAAFASAYAARAAGWERVLDLAARELGGCLTYAASGPEEAPLAEVYAGLSVYAEQLLDPLFDASDEVLRAELAGRLAALAERGAERGLPAAVVWSGFPGTSAARSSPRAPRGATDPAERARLLGALLGARADALERGADLRGLLLARWSTDPFAGGASARGHELQDGPAEEVLRAWLAGP